MNSGVRNAKNRIPGMLASIATKRKPLIMKSCTVRGQSVNLRMLDGRDQNGVAKHQVVCLLEGKTGELMLIFVASQATWDQMMIDDFIQSIR